MAKNGIIKSLLSSAISIGLTAAILLGGVCFYLVKKLPDVSTLQKVDLQEPMRIFSRDGKLIAIYGEKHRIPISLESIPKPLIQALISTEDQRFYEHGGVDFLGLARAAIAVITTGHKTQGASTITMQVARNFFLSRKKTYLRKLNEILLAIEIDGKLSKQKILELYFNKIFFGHRSYGIAAAAQYYYGKVPRDLALPQLAMLAGLPKSPSRNNPITNPEAALKRRNHVLARMLDQGYITQATFERASRAAVTAQPHGIKVQLNAPYVAEHVRQEMVQKLGEAAYTRGLRVYTTIDSRLQLTGQQVVRKGVEAYDKRHGWHKGIPNLQQSLGDNADQQAWLKTLAALPAHQDAQPAAITAVTEDNLELLLFDGSVGRVQRADFLWALTNTPQGWALAKPHRADHVFHAGDQVYVRPSTIPAPSMPATDDNQEQDQPTTSAMHYWTLVQKPQAEAALVAMDPQTGAILAMQGGYSEDANGFNRVSQAWRQPGSVFKPFLYSAALEKGMTLATLINDAPVVVEDSGEEALWRPNNYTKKFYGPTRVRVGLTKSRNIVSIRLLQQTGLDFALDYIQRFGFDKSKQPSGLSLALGAGLVTPLQIATGYAAFANGGYGVKPHLIAHVRDQRAELLPIGDEMNGGAERPRIISAENAFLIDNVLHDVIQHGTGRRAKILGRHDLAGKTGTTNKKMDAWFAGYNRDVVLAVWMGFDQVQALNEYGAGAALPIWIDFMRVALADKPEKTTQPPASIVSVHIDPETGQLAESDDGHAVFEYFRADHVPQRVQAQPPEAELNVRLRSSAHMPDKPPEKPDFSQPDTSSEDDNKSTQGLF